MQYSSGWLFDNLNGMGSPSKSASGLVVHCRRTVVKVNLYLTSSVPSAFFVKLIMF